MFKNKLDTSLGNINVPERILRCKDLKCKDIKCSEDINNYFQNIIDSIYEAGKGNIPIKTGKEKRESNGKLKKKVRPVPGWVEHVKVYRDSALFWAAVWKSLGKPQNTVTHSIYKATRNKYHLMIRRCKRAEKIIRNEKLFYSCTILNKDIYLKG